MSKILDDGHLSKISSKNPNLLEELNHRLGCHKSSCNRPTPLKKNYSRLELHKGAL